VIDEVLYYPKLTALKSEGLSVSDLWRIPRSCGAASLVLCPLRTLHPRPWRRTRRRSHHLRKVHIRHEACIEEHAELLIGLDLGANDAGICMAMIGIQIT
jgi:hypothetical protein